MKKAHVIIEPNVEVGTKTLAACGKEHKVKVLWADVPDDHPICRDCVDAVLEAVNDANETADLVSRMAIRAYTSVSLLREIAGGTPNAMTELIDRAEEYAEERRAKQVEKEVKAARKSAKKCTCLWVHDEDRILQLDCPVHDPAPDTALVITEDEPGSDTDAERVQRRDAAAIARAEDEDHYYDAALADDDG